ncbi:MAG: FAD:protein FMN transferase [Clostridia bacterium]|nr:FAD:protein FMN transferase [Clostridia bacterium]
MKKLKTSCIAISAVLAVTLSTSVVAGCGRSYDIYTNIPQGQYEITDKEYALAQTIDGYTTAQKGEETFPDTSGYTPMSYSFFFMTTDATLFLYEDFTAEGATAKFENFKKAVSSTLDKIDKAISTGVENSDIKRFNRMPAGELLEISKITYEVLQEAKHVYEWTGGYYNPALYYNVQAYGFGSGNSYPKTNEELPSDEVIAKYTDLSTHFGEIVLEESNGRYFVVKPEYTVEVEGETLSLKLDLGGIGKGYAVDKVDELFDDYGYRFGYFNFGSSSMLVKYYDSNTPFTIGLSGPRTPSRDPYVKIPIANEKLSTSGDNEQNYTIDGKRYCHIIDPKTGKPIETGIMSATVIGGSACTDDALTTALLAMGKDRAVEFIQNELKDRKVVFVCE